LPLTLDSPTTLTIDNNTCDPATSNWAGSRNFGVL
jgi:hypothetical protein